MIDQVTLDPERAFYGVWEDNVEALSMFLRLQTQWVFTGAKFVGLNYQSAEFLIKIHGADPLVMMDDLQAMELAALQVINKKD
jgi:hypothetical protein